MRKVTLCLVEEVESGDWGIGGNALTTADVHALRAEKLCDGATARTVRSRQDTVVTGGATGR